MDVDHAPTSAGAMPWVGRTGPSHASSTMSGSPPKTTVEWLIDIESNSLVFSDVNAPTSDMILGALGKLLFEESRIPEDDGLSLAFAAEYISAAAPALSNDLLLDVVQHMSRLGHVVPTCDEFHIKFTPIGIDWFTSSYEL